MNDFKLFEQALSEYKDKTDDKSFKDECKDECKHDNITIENGLVTCGYCGEEIKMKPECKNLKSFNRTNIKKNTDPTRLQIRKSEDRNIFKDVEQMGFSDTIVVDANHLYNQVTNGDIFRGNSRKSIIFACIFHAYKLDGRPQSQSKLMNTFSLSRKSCSKGLKYVNLHAPKDSIIHTTYITSEHLLCDIMDQFKANDKQKEEVISLYKQIKNKSSKLNRSRPQSVSAGLIYYWITKNNMNISLKEFSKTSNLSGLTIDKISKEIAKILNKN